MAPPGNTEATLEMFAARFSEISPRGLQVPARGGRSTSSARIASPLLCPACSLPLKLPLQLKSGSSTELSRARKRTTLPATWCCADCCAALGRSGKAFIAPVFENLAPKSFNAARHMFATSRQEPKLTSPVCTLQGHTESGGIGKRSRTR